MGWREALIERFFGGAMEARVEEASLSEEDRGWRALAQPGAARDITYTEQLENLRDAAEAYRVNPLAYRIVELTTDYVLGLGMRLRSGDAEAQVFIGAFWEANRMGTRQFELCTELSLAGELFVTFHTNPYDGMSYVRCIPASAIDRIETNPEDIEDERRYHQVGVMQPALSQSEKGNASIGAATAEGRWWPAEDCRHYAINRLVGAVRGQGDLGPLLPWLRRYKDWLTDRVRINKFKGAFLWDVKLTGASERAILARQAQLSEPPSPGSVLVHNEREEWRAVQPQIDAQASQNAPI
ncbi:MAG: hypothetical protein M1380_00100, partial [Chloroflexi bacterium]|nr:hypothetical protein [Chloroflexota bacterium]